MIAMGQERELSLHKRMWIVVMIWTLVSIETLSRNQMILTCESNSRPDEDRGLGPADRLASSDTVDIPDFVMLNRNRDKNDSERFHGILTLGPWPLYILDDGRFSAWYEGPNHTFGGEPEASNNASEESGSQSDEPKQRQKKKQQKKLSSECVCQCRPSDRAKARRFLSRPCRFQWKFAHVRIPPTSAHDCPGPSPAPRPTTSPGRRRQRLESRAWNVDCAPNHKGQAQRNSLSCRNKPVDPFCLRPGGPAGKGKRGVVDLLLMSEHQRKVTKGSGSLNLIRHLLVSLACLELLLMRDHLGQKKTARLGKLYPLLLLRRPVLDKRTASMEKAIKNFFRSHGVVFPWSVDRTVAGFAVAPPEKAHEPCRVDTCELRFSKCSKCRDGLEVCPPSDLRWMKRNPDLGLFVPPTRLWVAPAAGFLPSVTSRDAHFLDHVGYRLASLATLPPSCTLSRVRLAEAGFHYDPRANPSAVVCHACGAAYSLDPSRDSSSVVPSTTPLAFHRAESPHCQFLAPVLERRGGDVPAPPPPAPSVARASAGGGQAGGVVLLQSSSESGDPAAQTLTAFPARHIGGSDDIDGRDLSEDSEAAGPANPASTPPGDRTRRAQQSQPSTGYTLALAGAQTDQTSLPPVTAARHQDRDGVGDRPQLTLGNAVYPQFSAAQSRLATFRNWPLAAVFSPQMLVMLGFYYAGYADCVRCFFCGVGLKSWDESDDILTEHVRWRPNCAFLLATKGRQCIQNTLNRIRANNTDAPEDRPPTSQHSTPPHTHRPSTACNTTPSTRTRIPAAVSSISGARGASAARAGSSGSPPDCPREGLHTDGGAGRPRNDGNPEVRQQLLTMGFPPEDISRAQAGLRSAGELDDLEHTLNSLLPE